MKSDEHKQETLLIVDDEADIREILEAMLSPIVGKVLTAANGREALALAQSQSPTAILSDINMPQMSGLQLLAELRQRSISTPFVLLTAFGDYDNIREALRLDATDFITKPFDQAELLEVMKRAISYGAALKQIESELSDVYSISHLPADQQVRLRKIQFATQAMRIENSIYVKGKKSA